MRLDYDQIKRMSLGGTTALPGSPLSIGNITRDEVPQLTEDTLIHVTNPKSHTDAIVWSVRAGDVAAYERKDKADPDESRGEAKPEWYLGWFAVLNALNPNGKDRGVLYVRDEAQVLLRLEYGLTANHSVQVAGQAGVVPVDSDLDETFTTKCFRTCC